MTAPRPTWTPALRDRCRENCAFYGEPPCWQMDDGEGPPCSHCVEGGDVWNEEGVDP